MPMIASNARWAVSGFLCLAATTVLVVGSVGCATLDATNRDDTLVSGESLGSMTITAGLADYQVIQRDTNEQGLIVCRGTCAEQGEVWAHVITQSNNRVTIKCHQAGQSRDGRWSAIIKELPTGGAYTINLAIRDQSGRSLASRQARNILVGDLWVLAGQSNMQGYGDMIDVVAPSVWVHCYEMNETWSIAQEPLHRLNESPDSVHHDRKVRSATPDEIEKDRSQPRGPLDKGAGLGLPFAKELYARTRVPIGLVPCAHGGTSMDQWDPAKKDVGGRSLYGSMLRRFRAVGGKVKGILWYQGESDVFPDPEGHKTYHAKFTRFIRAVRRDFGNPELPFYLVQVSRSTDFPVDANAFSAIREHQRLISREMSGVVVVAAIDLELDDCIHIGTQGLKRLGRRLAVVADHELFGNRSVSDGPRLASVVVEGPDRKTIRVTFDHVNGRLTPSRHIAGFSLRSDDDKQGCEFFDVVVDREQPNSILCQLYRPMPAGMNLWYGYGLNPYCNLVDAKDMAVLAFGPIRLTPSDAKQR